MTFMSWRRAYELTEQKDYKDRPDAQNGLVRTYKAGVLVQVSEECPVCRAELLPGKPCKICKPKRKRRIVGLDHLEL